jgi:hypothetical protein
MKNARRSLAVLAMASALVAVSQLPAIAQARPAIAADRMVGSATAAKLPIYVIYHSKRYSRISDVGSITNGQAGEVLRFYADRFPFRGWHEVAHKTLRHSGTTDFRFKAQPVLATRFRTKLFASAGSRSPISAGRIHTAYVLGGYLDRYAKTCARPTCDVTDHVTAFIPRSAFRREFRKHVYLYFGYKLSPTTEPKLPKYLKLGKDGARITGKRKVAANEYEMTLHWTFHVGDEGYHFEFKFCTKNTESKDGLFLPGHHSCGAARISSHLRYLG